MDDLDFKPTRTPKNMISKGDGVNNSKITILSFYNYKWNNQILIVIFQYYTIAFWRSFLYEYLYY